MPEDRMEKELKSSREGSVHGAEEPWFYYNHPLRSRVYGGC